jgi:hypothetical protein
VVHGGRRGTYRGAYVQVGWEVRWMGDMSSTSGVISIPVGEMDVNDDNICEPDFGFVVLRWLQV